MPRLYSENIMPNNRASMSQQQWSTANNQGKKVLIQVFKISWRYLIISKKKKLLAENNYRDPYMLHRTQSSSTQQDYHSVREQPLGIGINNEYATGLGGVGRRTMDGNEMNAFQPKGNIIN